MEVLLNNILGVKDLSKMIEDYSSVRIPESIKHMRTTWKRIWNEICDKEFYKVDSYITMTTQKGEAYPEWILPNPLVVRIQSFSNTKIVDLEVKIVRLDEDSGNIHIFIPKLGEVILSISNKYIFNHQTNTVFTYVISNNIKIDIDIMQYEDFDFKLEESKSIS